ncbi:MAG: decaprenyl-phosphate phosphoribosyltransferase [Flavobacteriales bacterium]|nr:decaprenyl-phosphate phosphoribosyltransferase [Flavobacteriales bacterium]
MEKISHKSKEANQFMLIFFRLMRVHQWVKNLFLLLPLFFAGKLFEYDLLLNVFWGFLCFSMAASAVYILNDYKDIESDRNHPSKKNRPLASGAVKPSTAIILGILLLVLAFSGAWFLSLRFLVILAAYFVMNVAYTFGLKHIAVLDTTIIATGFVLRVMAGGAVADIPVSQWIVLMTFLLALLLGFAKRRDDVLIYMDSGKKMRKSVDGYNLEFINLSMVMMAGVVIVSYIMYVLSDEVAERWDAHNLYITAFPVILGVLRYLQLTFVRGKTGNPTKILLKDRVIQVVIISWVALFYLIIYMRALREPLGL